MYTNILLSRTGLLSCGIIWFQMFLRSLILKISKNLTFPVSHETLLWDWSWRRICCATKYIGHTIGSNITSVSKDFSKTMVKYGVSTEVPGKTEISHQSLWGRIIHFSLMRRPHSVPETENRLMYARQYSKN